MFTARAPFLAVALTASLPLLLAVMPGATPPPPADAFVGTPAIADPAVSPDGTRVAFVARIGEGQVFALFDLRTGKVAPVTRGPHGNIDRFFWKGNNRIGFAINTGEAVGEVEVLDLKTNELIDVFGTLVDPLPFDPTHVLAYNTADQAGLYLISTITGRASGVWGGDPNTGAWAADGDAHMRFRKRYAEGQMILELRADNNALWTTLATYPAALSAVYPRAQFRGFGRDPAIAYFSRNDENGHGAVFAVNTKTLDWGRPIAEVDGDIVAVRLSPKHDRVEEIEFGPDAEQRWLDANLARLVGSLQASFPAGYRVDLVSSDEAEQVFVVAVSADVFPTVYYLLDTRGKAQLVELGKTRPDLTPKQLQPMRHISYRARDGLTIHGYLTLPKAAATGVRVPLIVRPHPWPFGDWDRWGFDPDTQFLASRGYAVLQPNYRGSGGYGENFVLAGRREIGRKMEDDLTDGVKWAIDQGIADPRRIAIYGSGYGGYAALIGAEFTPDLYRCAINFSGPTSLKLVTSWQNKQLESGRAFVADMIGEDKAVNEAYSPVNFVDRIKIPTLHAYAEREQWIKPQSWSQLERELKKHHKTYEYVSKGKGRVGFGNDESLIGFYTALDAFLAKNLLPESSTATP